MQPADSKQGTDCVVRFLNGKIMRHLVYILKRLFSGLIYRFLMIGLPQKWVPDENDTNSDIAIVSLGALGDFILLCSIAEKLYHSGLRLILVCRKGVGIEEFAALVGYFEKVIALPYQPSRRPGNLRLLKKVKACTVISAPPERHIYSDLCVLSLQARRRILPDTLQGCSLPTIKRIVDRHVDQLVPITARYELDRYEQYLHGAKIYAGHIKYYTFEWVKANTKEEKQRIAIFPGAGGGPAKQWPVERFTYVALNLCREYNSEVLICGTDSEEPLIQKFREILPEDIRCLRGPTALSKLIQQLHECSLAVVNDSGSAYLAMSCGVPTLIIGGCWEYGRFYPGRCLPTNCKALIASVDTIRCAPCGKSTPDCTTDGAAPCVLAIDQEEVLSVARIYLAKDN